MSMMHAALAWHNDGNVSVIPIAANGTKRPMVKWEPFILDTPSRLQVRTWFTDWPTAGIAVICGKVSGGLEMLELEGRATSSAHLDKIVAACDERGITWLWDQLTQQGYAEWTPSGGIHLIYRVRGGIVPGNTKIAQDAGRLCLAETRGEGGYVVVAPSGGTVHKTEEPWTVAAGETGVIPTIAWADRCLLHEAIKAALDETPPPPVLPERRPIMSTRPEGTISVGDDFCLRTDWHDLLPSWGWEFVSQKGIESFWLHPNSASGAEHSASTNFKGSDKLYVWSSSTVFKQEEPYSKFAAYTMLQHGGDFTAATKDLSAKGFGTPLERSAPTVRNVLLDSCEAVETAAPDLEGKGETVPYTTPEHPSRPVGWKEKFSPPVLTVKEFLAEDFDLQGAGNLFAKAYEDAFKYCDDTKLWWFWDGKLWQRAGERFEQASKRLLDIGKLAARQATVAEEPYAKALNAHVKKLANASSPNIGRWARSDDRIAIKCEELDANSHLVTVANGIYDLDSHTVMPHDPKMLLTKQLPVAFDKDAAAPQWEAFLAQSLPDPEIRTYLQKAIGHTLLGNAEQRALFLLHGPSGTGKSVFIRMMEQLFGDFAETATPATLNASSKTATLTNDLNDLKGKRFVSISELDEGEVLNESLVKRLTGGDTAKSRGLWQENSKWRVQFTMWLATNNLPRLNSDDNAIWRRVKPIGFSQVAADNGGEILRLAEKIFATEASGILNWVLDGVRMYQDEGLDDLAQITDAVEAYRKEVDVVEQFLTDAVENQLVIVSKGSEIQSTRLYHIYTSWCQRNGIKAILAHRRFTPRLIRAGFALKKTSAANIFTGIGIGHHGMLGTMT